MIQVCYINRSLKQSFLNAKLRKKPDDLEQRPLFIVGGLSRARSPSPTFSRRRSSSSDRLAAARANVSYHTGTSYNSSTSMSQPYSNPAETPAYQTLSQTSVRSRSPPVSPTNSYPQYSRTQPSSSSSTGSFSGTVIYPQHTPAATFGSSDSQRPRSSNLSPKKENSCCVQ